MFPTLPRLINSIDIYNVPGCIYVYMCVFCIQDVGIYAFNVHVLYLYVCECVYMHTLFIV